MLDGPSTTLVRLLFTVMMNHGAPDMRSSKGHRRESQAQDKSKNRECDLVASETLIDARPSSSRVCRQIIREMAIYEIDNDTKQRHTMLPWPVSSSERSSSRLESVEPY